MEHLYNPVTLTSLGSGGVDPVDEGVAGVGVAKCQACPCLPG